MPLEPIVPPYLPGPSPGLEARLHALARAARAGKAGAQTELRQACQMLEAHFISWLPYGPTEETYDYLLDDALSRAVSQGGGIGLAKALEAQLARNIPPPQQPTNAPTHDEGKD